jgi:hypothetical protein
MNHSFIANNTIACEAAAELFRIGGAAPASERWWRTTSSTSSGTIAR